MAATLATLKIRTDDAVRRPRRLLCRWSRDPATGRMVCRWVTAFRPVIVGEDHRKVDTVVPFNTANAL